MEFLMGRQTMVTIQLRELLFTCNMVCLHLPPAGFPVFPTTAWASSWQTLVMTCGWETAEGLPGGPGNTYT